MTTVQCDLTILFFLLKIILIYGNSGYEHNMNSYWIKRYDIPPEQMTEEQRLLYHLIRSYDRSSRPVYKAATPVVIRLGITLTQILDVDEKNQILTTNIWLDQEWIDEKLHWTNISEFQNIKILRIPCDLLWLPDIVLYNRSWLQRRNHKIFDARGDLLYTCTFLKADLPEAFLYLRPKFSKLEIKPSSLTSTKASNTTNLVYNSTVFAWNNSLLSFLTSTKAGNIKMCVDNHNKGYMRSLAMVESNGNVFWPPIVKMRSSCKMDITYFPFDDQICKLKLGSWAYDGFQVDVTNRTDNVDLSNYVDNGEWTLVNTKMVRNVIRYPCCPEPFPDVTFYIHMRRRVLYYAFNVIIPCMLLSALTLTGFLLPPDSGEKVTLGLTVLLAFSVFMLLIAENMPPTSEYIPLIGIYLTIIMAMSGLSVVFSVFVLNIHHKGTFSKGPPICLKRMARFLSRVFCMKIKFYEDLVNHNININYSPGNFSYKSRDNEALIHLDKRQQHKLHVDIGEVHSDALNDVMNQNINVTSPTSPRTSIDREILNYFHQIMCSHEKTVSEKRSIHEWQEIARVMDKFFFWLFLSITSISTFVLLVISPMTKEIRLD